ncbi:MAG: hypothetical protein MZV49_24250 [Rhodopseudomonas palustris]|nr:hypothetical protein [Rhodopseudomonas palustris]
MDGYHKRVTTMTVLNRWDTWKFIVDGTRGGNIWIDSYLNGVHQGGFWYFNPTTATPSRVQVQMYNEVAQGSRTDEVHIDCIKIYTDVSTNNVLEGEYQYAVTYYRGGNFLQSRTPSRASTDPSRSRARERTT